MVTLIAYCSQGSHTQQPPHYCVIVLMSTMSCHIVTAMSSMGLNKMIRLDGKFLGSRLRTAEHKIIILIMRSESQFSAGAGAGL